MSTVEHRHPSDHGYEDAAEVKPDGKGFVTPTETANDDDPRPEELMKIAQAAVRAADSSDAAQRRASWARSHRAFRNKHHSGSKYLDKRFSPARSKLFVPKTRSAIRKNMATAAAALFSTEDVVSVAPQDDRDPIHVADAKLQGAILNYRLDRTAAQAGIPWFLQTMGSVQDAQIFGVCCSKQYWEWEEVPVTVDKEVPDVLDMQTRQPITQPEKDFRILRDRPMVDLLPADHIIVDGAAPWHDVIQLGRLLIAMYPMHVADVKERMRPGRQPMGGGGWKHLPDTMIAQASDKKTHEDVRRARQDGTDRFERSQQPTLKDFDIVWVHENFIRFNGVDYHFWSLGDRHFLTDPTAVEKVYPAHGGERPYVRGFGSIEAHNPFPMSPVESWQPLQVETNDLRNLRLDQVKASVSPITKVRRGNRVDLLALDHRGPEAKILVKDMEDVQFERQPDASQGSFMEGQHLNNDFDELAGSFSTSSVQSNRQLNETVGGMRLLSSNANALTEFDLRVWVETWVEPVLRQVIKLERYYESDKIILNMAAKEIEEMESLGLRPDDERLLSNEVTLRVNVGIGAADPMQKLEKFLFSLRAIMEIAPAFEGRVKAEPEPILDEIFGLAGHRDSSRFFNILEENEVPPPPELELEKAKMEQESERNAIEREKIEQKDRQAELEGKIDIILAQLKEQADAKHLQQEIKGDVVRELVKELMRGAQAEEQFGRDMERDEAGAARDMEREQMQVAGDVGEGEEAAPAPDPVLQALLQQGEALQGMLEILSQSAAAPKRVVRDESGRVIGVERA